MTRPAGAGPDAADIVRPRAETKRAAASAYGRELSDAEFAQLIARCRGLEAYWGYYLRVASAG